MDRMYLQKTKGFYRLWACSGDRHYRHNGGPLTLAGAYREAGERVRNGFFNKGERRQPELSEVDKWIDNDNHVVAVVGDIQYRSCPCPGESFMVIGRNVVAGGFEVNTWFCETPLLVEFDVTEKQSHWIVSRRGKAWPRRFENEDEALQALGRYVLGGGDSELKEQAFTKLVLVPFDCLWQTQALVDDLWCDLGELTTDEVKGLIDSGVVTTP